VDNRRAGALRSLQGPGTVSVTALIYRPSLVATDRNGDPIDADGNVVRNESPGTYLGELTIVLSDSQSEPILPRLTGSGGGSVDRAEAADVSVNIGAPINAEILLQHGDRIVIVDAGFGLYYEVFGPRRFATPNSLCPNWGHRLYWVSAIATDG
jgi:hypothetical protein